MQSKVIDYRIVTAEYTRSLIDEVLELIKDGWQPLGGVCFDGWVYQVMVKYENPELLNPLTI